MTFDTIMFREQGAIAWLTLNRPDRLNAICRPMLGEISQALDQAAEMPGLRALIVTGADRAFCAGQDLTEPAIDRENPAEAVAESLDRYYHPVLRRMRALQLPVVAAVNGVAAGAGANFALNCDIVVAADDCRFSQLEPKRAIHATGGATIRFVERAGWGNAMYHLLTGRPPFQAASRSAA